MAKLWQHLTQSIRRHIIAPWHNWRHTKHYRRSDQRVVRALRTRRWPSSAQWHQWHRVLAPWELRLVRLFSFGMIVGLVALGGLWYSRNLVTAPASGGEYIEAVVGGPRAINPILLTNNQTDRDLSRLMYSSLFRYNNRRELIPDLITTSEIASDQKTYTFGLRQDVTWHDGEPLTAHDIAFTIDSILDPQIKSSLAATFRGVTAEAVDDYTIRFVLSEPYAPFVGLLTFGIIPEHVWANVDSSNFALTEYNLRPIGSGPWKYSGFSKNKNSGSIASYTVTRNNDYYDETQTPLLERITFKYYGDTAGAIEAVKNKNALGISFVPKTERDSIAKNKNLIPYLLNLPEYTAIFFNTQRLAVLKEKNIRQALATAVDKSAIITEALHDEGELIHSPILPGYLGYHEAVKKYDFNPTQAASMLEAEGWKIDPTNTTTPNVRRKNNQPLSLTIAVADDPTQTKIGEMVAAMWRNVGVDANVLTIPASQLVRQNIRNRDYDVLIFGENIGFDPDPFPYWHSSQNQHPGLNLSVFTNKRVDELLETARQESDANERTGKYREFQDLIADFVPAVFLYVPTYTYVVDQNIKGIDARDIITPVDRFANLHQWYVKTRKKFQPQ